MSYVIFRFVVVGFDVGHEYTVIDVAISEQNRQRIGAVAQTNERYNLVFFIVHAVGN